MIRMPYSDNFNHGNETSPSEAQPSDKTGRMEQAWTDKALLPTGCTSTAGLHRCARFRHRSYELARRQCRTNPEGGRHARIRGDRRAQQLRLPRQYLLCVLASGGAALLDLAEIRRRQLSADRRRSGAILDRVARPADLHVQAALECAVS